MTSNRRLDRGFFNRSAEVVARLLIGCILNVDVGTRDEVRAEIVEAEAYLGSGDLASHARRGPTPRSAIMFGPPGHLYVYFTYGMHHCANIVTNVDGEAGAVLLRAAAVVQGGDVALRRRQPGTGLPVAHDALLRGPGNLCRGLGLDLTDNGMDVCDPGSRLFVAPRPGDTPPLAVGPRIGIRRAIDSPLRFVWAGHPAVSVPMRGLTPPSSGTSSPDTA